MILNQDQEKAAQAFFQFLMSDDKYFNISGPAGTGKTTLMQHLLNKTLDEYKDACKLLSLPFHNYEVVLSATTNKAAEVLGTTTSRTAVTIHSHLSLKVIDDYKTGQTKIKPTNNWKVHTHQLVFIDEASMVDSTLYEFIEKGFDNTCKIVFLGDHCQMAPVFETISPIYRNPKNMVFLRQPMRNASQPALMQLCNQLRRTVETLEFQPIFEVPGVIEYLSPQEAYAFIDATFNVENAPNRILAYSNARVLEYNTYIRGLRGYPDTLSQGERVINNTGMNVGPFMLRIEEEFEILSVDSTPQTIVLPGTSLDVYEVEIANPPQYQKGLKLKVPFDPDHLKNLMRYFAGRKDWDTYFYLKNTFPDLRSKDAATVYKAQGSTYNTVFLDLHNIGKCAQRDQLARMLYVGASRATTSLKLFGKLPDRLFKKQAT